MVNVGVPATETFPEPLASHEVVTAIDHELGGSMGISPESTQFGLQGIENVLK